MAADEIHQTHLLVMVKIKQKVEQLLQDPFLDDLSSDISLEEVKSRLAVEQGRAITIYVRRFDNEIICK